jgi:hypothetical protein
MLGWILSSADVEIDGAEDYEALGNVLEGEVDAGLVQAFV